VRNDEFTYELWAFFSQPFLRNFTVNYSLMRHPSHCAKEARASAGAPAQLELFLMTCL